MIEDRLAHILNKAQQSSSCHQKFLKILEKVYKDTPFEDFCQCFVKYLETMFSEEQTGRNHFIERCLDFCSKFVTEVARESDKESETQSDISDAPHPFLARIIQETLEYHDLELVQARYYSCKFIMLLLQNIGYDTHLDNDICDAIQEAMLERMLDPKPNIRLQAITALVRLQEPLNPDCPVIKAYLLCFNDASAAVRKEVVKKIAPNSVTIPKVKERVRDVDYSVRLSAFTRCADIGPKLFKIVDRQSILISGFNEMHKLTKQVFLENLIPKWLTVYNGNYLQFLSAIKLDADEEDIQSTATLSAKLMEVFFRSNPLSDIIAGLPLEDKLVPLDKLSTEVVTYWCIITNHLRASEEGEEYLDKILPELTHFSNYIDSVLKHKSHRKMDEWEFLDFQHILLNLFEMAEKYDFSDEVGRKALLNLIYTIIQHYKFSINLIGKLIRIGEKLSTNVDMFMQDICQIISDIREPLVDEPPSKEQTMKRDFMLAEVKVKMDILNQDKDDAVEKQDFEKAALIREKLVELRKKVDEISREFEGEKVKVTRDDLDTTCRCLDILISILQLPSVKTLSDTLRTCKDEFIMPMISSNVSEIHWRVLKCVTLFCIIDKTTAEESAKIICFPIALYRTVPNYDKSTLIVAVEGISDLIRLYTASVLCSSEDDSASTSNQSTRRRLYRNEDMDESAAISQNKMNVEFIIEIILDMLDDENDEIRNVAIDAVAKLILDTFPVSPYLISRMILKWYSPLTGTSTATPNSRSMKLRRLENEKHDAKLQQKLGVLIERYTETVKGAKEIVEKSVLPTVMSIANAPKTSPLADIDVDNVLRFLAAITNVSGTGPGIVNVHSSLAHSLLFKIACKPQDQCVPYMAKLLLYLEIPPAETSTQELIHQAELLLEDIVDKAPKRNINKFIMILKTSLENQSIITNQEETRPENTENKENQLSNDTTKAGHNTEDDSRSDYNIDDTTSNSCDTQSVIVNQRDQKATDSETADAHKNNGVVVNNNPKKNNLNEMKNNADNQRPKVNIVSNVLLQHNNNQVPNGKTNSEIQNNTNNNKPIRAPSEDRISSQKSTPRRKSKDGKVSNCNSSSELLQPRKTRAMANSEKISTRSRISRNLSVLLTPLGTKRTRTPLRNNRLSGRDALSETDSSSPRSLKSTKGDRLKVNEKTSDAKVSSGKKNNSFKETPRTIAKKQIVVVNLKRKDSFVTKKIILEKVYDKQDNIKDDIKNKLVEKDNSSLDNSKASSDDGKNARIRGKKASSDRERKALYDTESSSDDTVFSSPRTRGKRIDIGKLLNLTPRNKKKAQNVASDHKDKHKEPSTSNISVLPIAESTRNLTKNSTMNSSNEENSNLLSNLASPRQVKRKKSICGFIPDKNVSSDDTVLHTIVEQTFDVPSLLEGTLFQSPSNTSGTSESSVRRRSGRRKVVVSMISSDSELSSSSSNVRQMRRRRKKKKVED